MKPYVVKALQLDNWDEKVSGLWLDENEDWMLLRSIHDYRPDGYLLVAKYFIVSETPKNKKLLQAARVLKLKGVDSTAPANFAFGSIPTMLQWVEQHYKVFQFQDEEDTSFCGQLRDYDENDYQINSLSPSAELDLDYDLWFAFKDLVTIEFDSDYLNSLRLLWQDKVKRKWKLDQRNQFN
jgi:hypothetical protein